MSVNSPVETQPFVADQDLITRIDALRQRHPAAAEAHARAVIRAAHRLQVALRLLRQRRRALALLLDERGPEGHDAAAVSDCSARIR